MKIDTKEKVIDHINSSYKAYQGYVQFSHRKIEKDKDIFLKGNVEVSDEKGFIYEAHFYNEAEQKSVQIRQINDGWLVSETDLKGDNEYEISYEAYISDIEAFSYKVQMAQVWKEEPDELCENMKVKKLQRVVFAGFEKEQR